MTKPIRNDLLQRAKRIKLVSFDIDGVLTDGRFFFGDDGQEYKSFNSRDSHGFRMLHSNGIQTAIITGRTCEAVKHHANNLDIDITYQGRRDKFAALNELVQQTGLSPDAIAHVGDDIVDLPIMLRVGLAIAVNDAHPLVIRHAHWRTENRGGHGAGRDVCELILDAHGLLKQEMQRYLPVT